MRGQPSSGRAYGVGLPERVALSDHCYLIRRPRGFRRLVKPLVVKVVRDSVEADYRRLKRLLEPVEEEDED